MTSFCPQCGRTFGDEVLVCEKDDVMLVANYRPLRYRVPVPGDQLGPYRLVDCIEVGGMALIFRAEDTRQRREVAVKVLSPELAQDPEMAARFVREAHITRFIRHPNVVRIFDIVDDASPYPPYMAMELLEGQDLRHLLRRIGVLPPNEASKLAQKIAEALSEVHAAGVLHRDVKPDNIFLERSGSKVTVKLLDFGVALALNLPGQTRLTRHGCCVGTPDYISPEQVLGREMDERSDIYALGLLLYEMLAGYPPFKSSSARETLISQVDTYPAPIAQLRGEPIPEALEAVVMRCLRKQPADRFSSMKQLRNALRATRRRPIVAESVEARLSKAVEHFDHQA